MNLFDATLETANDSRALDYDDTYANLQHGLTSLQLHEAHRASTGRGVRIAIVDSDTDVDHEDLSGRIGRHEVFADKLATLDSHHGTAVASVIGARSNNARGMVGVAPAATLEIFVSCWRSARNKAAICDSFTLLKAIDAVLEDPPHVLNLSLTGPEDALLRRVLERAIDAGVIVVAACPLDTPPAQRFPATMQNVIAVGRADAPSIDAALAGSLVFAPGDEILVATPGDGYDFRSGSSLSAAHVSGIVALMLEASPTLSPDTVFAALLEAKHDGGPHASVSACRALQQVSHVQCPVPTAFD
jgi:subtilisin family serine protease